MSANKDKAVKELADQLSRDLQSRLVRAESNREILFNASLAKTKTFNHRVSEAQKKKEEIDNADLNKSVTEDLQLRLSSADLRRSLALEEFKEKASNDCAKVSSCPNPDSFSCTRTYGAVNGRLKRCLRA